MRDRGGGAIVVSTLAVRAINAGQGAYAATKGALTIAAQTLAREVGVDGIRANVVVPGFVPGPNTETMFARMAERQGTTPEAVKETTAADTALRRLPEPDEREIEAVVEVLRSGPQGFWRGRRVRVPPGGLPEAEAVMERGVLLPLSHAIDDDTLDFVIAQVEEFLG